MYVRMCIRMYEEHEYRWFIVGVYLLQLFSQLITLNYKLCNLYTFMSLSRRHSKNFQHTHLQRAHTLILSLSLPLSLYLLYLIRALESLSIWIVFIRFNFVLNTFSHFSCSQTILEWKLNFEIPSFYLSQVLCILFVLCFLFRCYFIFKSPMNCLTSSSSYSSSNFVHCIYDKIPI